MSTPISSQAEAIREQHRDPSGKFGSQPAAESSATVEATNTEVVEMLGEMSWEPSRFGETVTVQGPSLYLGAAVPAEHADDPAYLDKRFHRLQAYFEDNYGAKLTPGEDRHVESARVSWEIEHEDATPGQHADLQTRTVEQLSGPDGSATELAAHLREGEDGRTVMSQDLADYLAESDEAAKTPTDVTLTGDEDFWPHRTVDLDQKSLDYAVKTARDHIEISHRVRRVGARNGSIIAQTYSASGDKGRLAVYDANAWTPPSSTPMLAWSAPDAIPVARVDMDGHVSLLTGNDALCRDCGQPLDDMGSPNVKGCCLACTGEWADDRP
ncbi:hypothetical protein [Ornithinimicrobium murale]|uniref:hypothetical protein n=1 Tax=Ornithinimicrobium murale TaxID=1050153 RepID=UPI0013B3CCD4|nr:hypothetical protein [Ornithinimicrobium murale]